MRLDRATALAFSGRLRSATSALDAVDAGLPDHERPDARWLRAYLLAATGAFSDAETIARELIEHPDRVVRARATVTLGSVLRQTDRHAEALDIESAALSAPSTADLRKHLLIGSAADSVGLGDLAGVDAALAQVGSELVGGWRAGVRLRWVRCERELLASDPSEAARWARRALALAERAEARRHQAKSLLFLGAALREVVARSGGARAREARVDALASLGAARTIARRIGAEPIATVAHDLFGLLSRRG